MMRNYGPMRSAFSYIRKQRQLSLDGSVPGVEYNQKQSNLTGLIQQSHHHGTQTPCPEYNPDPGPMTISNSQYRHPSRQEGTLAFDPRASLEEQLFLPFIDSGPAESKPNYDKNQLTPEMWDILLKNFMDSQTEETNNTPIPEDLSVRAQELLTSQPSDLEPAAAAEPVSEQDSFEQAMMAQEALEQKVQESYQEPQDDPYLQAQNQFNQMMQILNISFAPPGP